MIPIISSLILSTDPLAHKLWLLCSASYCGEKKLEQWSCGPACEQSYNMTNVHILRNSTGQNAGYGVYVEEINSIVLIFRGTLPWLIKNFVDDLDFIKTQYELCEGCEVHRGFLFSAMSLQDQALMIYNKLNLQHPTAKFIITGHSLGAAIAIHTALYFKYVNHIDPDNIYTFGCPRLGNDKFAEFVNAAFSENYRITLKNDPMVRLPTQWMGFKHFSVEIYYDHHQNFKICDQSGEDKTCSDSDIFIENFDNHCRYMGYDIALHTLQCQ